LTTGVSGEETFLSIFLKAFLGIFLVFSVDYYLLGMAIDDLRDTNWDFSSNGV
jgi:hypothetical protein